MNSGTALDPRAIQRGAFDIYCFLNILLVVVFYSVKYEMFSRKFHALSMDIEAFGYFSSAIFFAGLFALPLLYRKPAVVVTWSTLVGILLITDTMSFAQLGVHFDEPGVWESLFSRHVTREVQLSVATWSSLGLLGVGLFVLQLLIFKVAKVISSTGSAIWFKYFTGVRAVFFALAFGFFAYPVNESVLGDGLLGSALLQRLTTNLQRWYFMVASESGSAATRHHAAASTSQIYRPEIVGEAGARPHILFILVESLRSDMASLEAMPNFSKLIKDNSCITSAQHYANSHMTEYGVFSGLYGEPAYHFERARHEKLESVPLAFLKQQGYRLQATASAPIHEWKGAGFIFSGFDELIIVNKNPVYLADQQMVENLVTALGQLHNNHTPSFQFVFLTSSHHNYSFPDTFAVHKPFLAESYNHFAGDDVLKSQREQIWHRYKNSVLWTDHLIGELWHMVAPAYEAKNLIIVVTGDHGEEFWEHGFLGHAGPHLVRERVSVPMAICHKSIQSVQAKVSSHADIMPTILNILGAKIRNSKSWTGSSLQPAMSANAEDEPSKLAVVSVAGLPAAADKFVVAHAGIKTQAAYIATSTKAIAIRKKTTDHYDRETPERPRLDDKLLQEIADDIFSAHVD